MTGPVSALGTQPQARILTVTLNPALDLATETARVVPELKLRCAPPLVDPGGGGINVSRAIARMDGLSTAVVALGGPAGARVEALIAKMTIEISTTTIATAAVQFALGGDRMMKVSRTPEVYADAAYEVLTKPARSYTGQTLIVEQVLRDAGVIDFAKYAATPGTPDSELFPDIFL